jgi:hypothetical protein
MANKLSTETSATDVAAGEETLRSRVSTTKGGGTSAREKSEPTTRKTVADVARQLKPSKSVAPKATKADLILKRLRTAKGASIEMLISDTRWQAHSIRGFLSAVVRKKLALNLVSEVGRDGVRRYRIDGDMKSA